MSKGRRITRIDGTGRQRAIIEMSIPIILTLERLGPNRFGWTESLRGARVRSICGLTSATSVLLAVVFSSLSECHSRGTLPQNPSQGVYDIFTLCVAILLFAFAQFFIRSLRSLRFGSRRCIVDLANNVLIESARSLSNHDVSERRLPLDQCRLILSKVSLSNDLWSGSCLMFVSNGFRFVIACGSETSIRQEVAAWDTKLSSMMCESHELVRGSAHVRRW